MIKFNGTPDPEFVAYLRSEGWTQISPDKWDYVPRRMGWLRRAFWRMLGFRY